MGGGGENQQAVIAHRLSSNAARRRRRQQRGRRDDELPALDLPPPVASPTPHWQARKLAARTPQHLCTLVHPPSLRRELRSSGDDPSHAMIRAGSAPCDPILVFGKHLLSATDDGRVCVYTINSDITFGSLPPQQAHQEDHQRGGERMAHQSSMGAIGPVCVVSLPLNRLVESSLSPDYPAVVALAATPTGWSVIRYRSRTDNDGSTVMPPHFLGHVAVLTSEGDIHLLEFTNKPQKLLGVTCVYSWNAGGGDGGATCLAVHSNHTATLDSRVLRICVGYTSGCLVDWEVSVPVTPDSRATTIVKRDAVEGRDASEHAIATEKGEQVAANEAADDEGHSYERYNVSWDQADSRLLWRGCFETSINSVSSLGLELFRKEENLNLSSSGNSGDDSKEGEVEKDAQSKAAERRTYLALCRVQVISDRFNDERSCASSIEVVNVASIERDWMEMFQENTSAGFDENDFVALPLDDYCTWPEAGMEIIEEPSEGRRTLPGSIVGIGDGATDRVCKYLEQTSASSKFHGSNASFAATLSKGTVALFHSFVNDTGSTDEPRAISWGIGQEGNQLLVSYPCIGVGQLDYPRDDSAFDGPASSPYLACCLRGGTVYLIPFLEMESDPTNQQMEIITFVCPDDDDSDTNDAIRYVQGFATGNIQIFDHANAAGEQKEKRKHTPGTPVFVYSWAGGIMNVCAAGLLSSPSQERDLSEVSTGSREPAAVLRDLIDNGSVKLVLDLLLSMTETDTLLDSELWKNAWNEISKQDDIGDATSVTQELLRHPPVKLLHFRSLLLWLSREPV